MYFPHFMMLLEVVYRILTIIALFYGVRVLISLRPLIESAAAYLDSRRQ